MRWRACGDVCCLLRPPERPPVERGAPAVCRAGAADVDAQVQEGQLGLPGLCSRGEAPRGPVPIGRANSAYQAFAAEVRRPGVQFRLGRQQRRGVQHMMGALGGRACAFAQPAAAPHRFGAQSSVRPPGTPSCRATFVPVRRWRAAPRVLLPRRWAPRAVCGRPPHSCTRLLLRARRQRVRLAPRRWAPRARRGRPTSRPAPRRRTSTSATKRRTSGGCATRSRCSRCAPSALPRVDARVDASSRSVGTPDCARAAAPRGPCPCPIRMPHRQMPLLRVCVRPPSLTLGQAELEMAEQFASRHCAGQPRPSSFCTKLKDQASKTRTVLAKLSSAQVLACFGNGWRAPRPLMQWARASLSRAHTMDGRGRVACSGRGPWRGVRVIADSASRRHLPPLPPNAVAARCGLLRCSQATNVDVWRDVRWDLFGPSANMEELNGHVSADAGCSRGR